MSRRVAGPPSPVVRFLLFDDAPRDAYRQPQPYLLRVRGLSTRGGSVCPDSTGRLPGGSDERFPGRPLQRTPNVLPQRKDNRR